jgi:hypothetical protein
MHHIKMTKGISDHEPIRDVKTLDAASAKATAEIEALNLRIKSLERIVYECVDVADATPADVPLVEDVIQKIGCDAYQRQAA